MDPMFYIAIVLGLAIITIYVGSTISEYRSRNRAAGPISRTLRQFQDQLANEGWRIPLITPDQSPGARHIRAPYALIPVVGGIAFTVGLALFSAEPVYHSAGKPLIFLGILTVMGWAWWNAKRPDHYWRVVNARCLDRELRQIRVRTTPGFVMGWFWRILCEYEYMGVKYRATPSVYWRNFQSQEEATAFLNERIRPDGTLLLRVNPECPLEAELVDPPAKMQ